MKTVYLVVEDSSMLNEPTNGAVHPIAAFSTEEKAQAWIDSKGIVASKTWAANTYDPRYYPFPYSIMELEVDEPA